MFHDKIATTDKNGDGVTCQ